MEEYIGKICPFCKTEIKEGDAVKVCPKCGISHHAVCWEKNKGCTTFGCSESDHDHTNICAKCGAPLGDKQAFCTNCGTPKGVEKRCICGKCGAELQEGQNFCPNCGTFYGTSVGTADSTAYATDKINGKVKKGNKKLIPIIAGAVIIVVIGIVLALFFVLRGIPVSEVSFNRETLTITEGKTAVLVCTVTPDDAKDKNLIWRSSNESVAKVDENGNITAVSEGTCTITATSSNGKTVECRIIVEKAGPDFQALYDEYCSLIWANVGSDGSYLSIDTNPFDKDDDGLAYPDAYKAIKNVNTALGLPDYVFEDMGSTTSLMGKQSETFDNIGITVSWSYHPDNGLEVTYKKNK